LAGEITARLDAELRSICDDLRSDVMALKIMPDHVRLVLRLSDASLGPAQIAFRRKGASSRILRPGFLSLRPRLPTPWSRSTYVGAVGAGCKSVIEHDVAA
jgi:REP element-mobilizing transposase RayT